MITLIVQTLFDHAAPFLAFPLVLFGGEVGLFPPCPVHFGGQNVHGHGELSLGKLQSRSRLDENISATECREQWTLLKEGG